MMFQFVHAWKRIQQNNSGLKQARTNSKRVITRSCQITKAQLYYHKSISSMKTNEKNNIFMFSTSCVEYFLCSTHLFNRFFSLLERFTGSHSLMIKKQQILLFNQFKKTNTLVLYTLCTFVSDAIHASYNYDTAFDRIMFKFNPVVSLVVMFYKTLIANYRINKMFSVHFKNSLLVSRLFVLH